MRIKLPLPRAWPVVSDAPWIAEVLPGVTLAATELFPLPNDLKAWGDEVVFGTVPRDEVRIAMVKDAGTKSDWPVTLFGSDLIHPRSKAVLERRLHAAFRFDRHGAIVTLRSANTIHFDSVVKDVIAILLQAEPDWAHGKILCLEDIWAGLQIERPAPAAPPSSESLTSLLGDY